jgi:predicted restriction endonuclease
MHEMREPRTVTIRLTDEQRNAARSRLSQAQRAEKEARRRRLIKTSKSAFKSQKDRDRAARKAAKVTRQLIDRAQPAPKPVQSFKSTWHAYRLGMISAEFCRTREWAKLRQSILIKYGARCQCCGASRETGAVMHVDHIKPRSKYPALELVADNLQVLCELCNIGKSNIDETDWR